MSFKIAILADTHLSNVTTTSQYAVWSKVIQALKLENPDLIVVLGDLTVCGDVAVAKKAMFELRSLEIPLQTVYGNSDERTRDSQEEIRKILNTDQPFFHSNVAVKLLACPDGRVLPNMIAELRQFIEANKASSVVVGSHYPPEHFEDIPEMQKLFASGSISIFLCAHLHYEHDYKYKNTNVRVVRGLDPDKAIGGPTAISMVEYNGTWSSSLIEIAEGCGRNWNLRQQSEFCDTIGICTMDQTIGGLELAAEKKIKNVELRYDYCQNESLINMKLMLKKWRMGNDRILSLHMPDLVFSDNGKLENNDQWQDAANFAIDLHFDRVTVHVPRTKLQTMQLADLRDTVVSKYLACIERLVAENIQVGVENLHMNLGEIDNTQRGFGYTPDECIGFINELRDMVDSQGIGFCLDIGHARNNPPYSSRISLSQWYAASGHLINGMHIHQVIQKVRGLKNHYPILDVFGPLISLQSLMWAWSTKQISRCPMFLEIRDFSKTLMSLETIQNYFRIK